MAAPGVRVRLRPRVRSGLCKWLRVRLRVWLPVRLWVWSVRKQLPVAEWRGLHGGLRVRAHAVECF